MKIIRDLVAQFEKSKLFRKEDVGLKVEKPEPLNETKIKRQKMDGRRGKTEVNYYHITKISIQIHERMTES